MKAKKCKSCEEVFQPVRSLQAVCSPLCAVKHAQKLNERKKDKELRKDTTERKKRLKTRSDWIKDAQKEVNAYVRLRDKGKLCISCDKPDDGSHQRHASHYRSTKAASSIRFYTLNIWASCAQCNTMESGNLIEYRIRLKAKYPWLPEYLESRNEIVRYDIEYLRRLIKIFRKKQRHITRLRAKRNLKNTV